MSTRTNYSLSKNWEPGANCVKEQLKNVQTTVEKLGLSLKVEYIADIQEIAKVAL